MLECQENWVPHSTNVLKWFEMFSLFLRYKRIFSKEKDKIFNPSLHSSTSVFKRALLHIWDRNGSLLKGLLNINSSFLMLLMKLLLIPVRTHSKTLSFYLSPLKWSITHLLLLHFDKSIILFPSERVKLPTTILMYYSWLTFPLLRPSNESEKLNLDFMFLSIKWCV